MGISGSWVLSPRRAHAWPFGALAVHNEASAASPLRLEISKVIKNWSVMLRYKSCHMNVAAVYRIKEDSWAIRTLQPQTLEATSNVQR
ncbi:hypothetical protein DV515_00002097 [Chloebia gouldiae]|uniref:Uncharacterized protein n=1 Tax=Chloebia gouldiae TaxID=44316 RepID=A0A3L8SW14_CHLGU|nr:hypothetical protein DV515_00002097 [Chloebia gouldiae]